MGRKTLSGSEMYAHCRNRHEQRHLREKLENLCEEEFVSMDFLKMETNKWRQFRRENLKSSGCSAEARQQGKNGNELIALNTASHTYPKARLYNKDPLHLPWVYTYNTDSHNQVCRDLLQSSINYKRSLTLRHQSLKKARLSKMSTSSSAESSGNETPRTSTHEDRKAARQFPKVKNAWVYSADEWRTGDRCPPNTPRELTSEFFPSSEESEIPENREFVFVTELKGPQHLMTKSFSTKAYNDSTKLTWVKPSLPEQQTRTDSSAQLRREVGHMDFFCDECGGKLTNSEGKRSELRGPQAFQKRLMSTDIKSNQPTHEIVALSEHITESKAKFCRCNSEPSFLHYNASTLTTDTIKTHFGNDGRHGKNLSFIFSPSKANNWRYKCIHEDPEDILESSFHLWDLPPYNPPEESNCRTESTPSTIRTHQREHPNPDASIHSARFEQNTNQTPFNLQPLDSVDNGKSVLLPRRRQARDETVNRIGLVDIQKHDRDAIVSSYDYSTGSDKIVSNEFQSHSPDSSHAKLSDSSEKSQVNLSDFSNENIEENGSIRQYHTHHDSPHDQSKALKERSKDDDKHKNNNNNFHQRRKNGSTNSKDSKRMNEKTNRNKEERSPHINPRVASGKNGILCGLPKVLQRKTQDLRSQIPTVSGSKPNSKSCTVPVSGNNFGTEVRLARSDSGVKSLQKRTLIEIKVKIPQVVKDEIVAKDAFIRAPSSSKMEKSVTEKEKASEPREDSEGKIMESCHEKKQNNVESSDRFSNSLSTRNSSIYTEGIKDQFALNGDPETISYENEYVNSTEITFNRKSSNSDIEKDNTNNTNIIATDNMDNNNGNNNNKMEVPIQNNQSKIRKRAASASGRLVSGNDDVYHKGILLSNYVSPEQRYKMTFKGSGSRPRLGAKSQSFVSSPDAHSNSYVIRLKFSKQARQQALAKLIEDNHSARGNSIQRALAESLQARIKAFCVSLEPYRQSTCL